jgi:hypothetical protein
MATTTISTITAARTPQTSSGDPGKEAIDTARTAQPTIYHNPNHIRELDRPKSEKKKNK